MGVKNNVSGPAGMPRPLSASRLSIVYQLDVPLETARASIDLNSVEDRIDSNDDIRVSVNLSLRSGRFDTPSELVADTRSTILFEDQIDEIRNEVRIAAAQAGTPVGTYIATR
jgi:hypothetical protein